MSLLLGTKRALLPGHPHDGLMAWDADDLDAIVKTGGVQALTFTPGMATRAVTVPAGGSLVAPLVQGKLDGTAGDVLSYGRGTQITGNLYDTMDGYQVTIAGSFHCEFAGDDSLLHYIWYSDADLYLAKTAANTLVLRWAGTDYTGPATAWAASATPHIAVAISTSNDIDGTNYVRFSVDNTHAYAGASAPTADTPGASLYIGSNGTGSQIAATVADFHIFRRVLTDGDNANIPHCEGGSLDEIADLYAAGAGAPAATVIADYAESCVFALPTNGTAGALTTGTGNALMAPLRSDALIDDWHGQTDYAASGCVTIGTPAAGPANDDVNMLFGARCYSFDPDAVDEGFYFPPETVTAGEDKSVSPWLMDDGAFAAKFQVWDNTNSAEVVARSTDAGGTWLNLPFCYEVPAGCTEIHYRILSTNAGQGVIKVQQCVVYPNLCDDPGMERGAAWTVVGGGVTSAQSAAQAHSGTNSWHLVTIAANQGVTRTINVTEGKFYAISVWVYNVSGRAYISPSGVSGTAMSAATTGSWQRVLVVGRATAATLVLGVKSLSPVTDVHIDDVFVQELDDVSLTCTPSSEANSRESMTLTPWGDGIETMRVDGKDTLTIPSSVMNAAEGSILFPFKFRHATAWANEVVCSAGAAAPNAFYIQRTAATNVIHVYYGDGNDASTATIADTDWHHITLTWAAGTCLLYIDAVLAAGFALTGATEPTLNATLYLGSAIAGTGQADIAYLGAATSSKALSAGRIAALYNQTTPWTLNNL